MSLVSVQHNNNDNRTNRRAHSRLIILQTAFGVPGLPGGAAANTAVEEPKIGQDFVTTLPLDLVDNHALEITPIIVPAIQTPARVLISFKC